MKPLTRSYFDERIERVSKARDETKNRTIRRMLAREVRRLEKLREKAP